MERKIIITGLILVICISVIIGVVFIYSGTKSRANPIKVIPQNAAYVLRLNGLDLASVLNNEKTSVWSDIDGLSPVQKINNEIKVLDSLISSNEKLRNYVEGNDIYISGHYAGGNNINHLTLFSIPASFNERDISSFLSKQAKNFISNSSMRKYEGKTIFSITLKSERIIYLTICNSIFVYSSSPVLIEDAIRQSTLNLSLLDNKEFFDMVSATGKNKAANLFIDYSQIGQLASLLSNSNYTTAFKEYKLLGHWSELDINIKSDLLLLNGFMHSEAKDNTFFASISQNDPVQLTIDKVLPASTAAFLAFGISSPEKSYESYLNYLKANDKLDRYQANLSNLNAKYGIEFEKFFLSLLDNELALVYKENSNNTVGANYLLLKCKSGYDANKQLVELTEKISTKNKKAKTQFYSPDNSIRYAIHKIPIYPLFQRVIGDFFDVFEECYFTVIDNYIVVAGSFEDASEFIYNYVLQKTLANDEVYKDFAENISMKSYALAYINLKRSDKFFSKYLKNEFIEDWEKNKASFTNVQATGFQISEVSNMAYFNVFLKRFGNYRGKPQTVWESLLDTTISLKPSFVINHYNKQNEIFIQDDKNNVYLINQAGRIIWKIRLSEKINSEIYQIDYYKNGKLQILFSSENYIHLIDRNGNYVDKYPVRLRERATAGLSVFDYDKNKNYRLFIPCANKKVYAYSKEGNVLSGWVFPGSDHIVDQTINHFRVEEKDFIVFADAGKTYILDRRGNERVILKTAFTKSLNNNFYLHNTNQVASSYLLTTNTMGKVVKIYFDGNTELLDLVQLSPNHYFDYKDINADGKSDYIFLDNNTLYVFDNNGENIFTKKIDGNISQRPVYYHFSHSNRKIGLVSETEEKIYLVNNNGELYKNFPLEGRTLFSIGYFDLTSSRFNLIVGGRNNFLYNYAVE
jgi:mRNA-degrading endonuclease YafQ of YafQ-DinJ toxin-antitoxin module